jgi:phosphoribosylamine--glycine ligase
VAEGRVRKRGKLSNNKKNVLVIGSGGREHALTWSLSISAGVGQVYCAPGNPGIQQTAKCVAIDPLDIKGLLQFAKEKKIDLTVVGPEGPLAAGLVDRFLAEGLAVLGPRQDAARLESSKVFAKNFMRSFDIPTADFMTFSQYDDALKFLRGRPQNSRYLVVKADGLAGGKGVIVCQDKAEVENALKMIMVDKAFGEAGRNVVLEERLEGEEVSVMVLTDGKTLLPLIPSQDHKRLNDGDKGPNTGGMGAYAPTPFLTEAAKAILERDIFENFLRGLHAKDIAFRGVIYFGLMMTKDGPRVLEFNIRFGDPELQTIVPLVDSDALDLLEAAAHGRLDSARLQRRHGATCCVVLASGGYPGPLKDPVPIEGLDEIDRKDHVIVFHAGTARAPGSTPEAPRTLAQGGRVLNVVGYGKNLEDAVVRAYQGIKHIRFDGMQYRHDIAGRALGQKADALERKIKAAAKR